MYTFQEIIAKLSAFWEAHGCCISQPYDLEKGAGTSNPATFFRCLGPEPFRAAYVEPCRRPKDGRYGTNPVRMQYYFQYQVILKPSPVNIQDLYLESLEAIGFDLSDYDIRFVHDDWEQPTLGAWGLGWEVWIDGLESSQFTYFQAMAELALKPITGELTYGLERLAMNLQKVDSFTKIQWNDQITYGDLYAQNEKEWTEYNFDVLDPQIALHTFEVYEKEAKRLVKLNLPLPAYDFVLKCSHTFNQLDARGVISVSERASYIAKIRDLARHVAESYLKSREKQGYPLLGKWPKEKDTDAPPPAKPVKITNKEKVDFLLEIGSEELPSSFVAAGAASLERQIKQLLDKEGLQYASLHTYGTPRRLAVEIRSLALRTSPKTVEKKGPSIDTAFDATGTPTQVGQGFLRSFGLNAVSLDEIRAGRCPGIEIQLIKGQPYLYGKQRIEAVEASDILQKALPQIVLGVDFPKKMRWADFDISYARPIRWIVALLDDQVLDFQVGPIRSGRRSFGHRQLSGAPFDINNASEYLTVLKEHKVLADIKERHQEILRQLSLLEKEQNAIALVKERVSHEVLHLVEMPFLTTAQFDTNFFKAPKEVLISEMVEHQKYFPMAKADGELLNSFVITANVPPTDSIRNGNRRVLSARLTDGVFLFEHDLKKPLESYNESLKTVIFQKGLGSLYDKVERLCSHVKMLHPFLPQANLEYALAAAELSKADLATEMVGEFPELQGQMGRIYASRQNKPEKVSLAIDEHWMPRGEKGELPHTYEGTLCSLADKIDNLLGFFGLGLKPTSSSDPYALRRQTIGLVRIILDKKISLPLTQVLTQALKSFPKPIQEKGTPLVEEVLTYCILRAKGVLQEMGYPKDEIEACLSVRSDDIFDVLSRLIAIHDFRQESATFAQLVEVHKRCQGQTGGLVRKKLSSALFREQAEKKLHTSIENSRTPYVQAIKTQKYRAALGILANLQPQLAELFDQVKILDDVEEIRNNRLALLQEVALLFAEVADFQKIQ